MPKPCGILFKALIVPHYFGFHFYNLFKNFTFVHLTFYALFWRINWLLGIFFAVIFFPYSIKQDTKSLLGINEKFLVFKEIYPPQNLSLRELYSPFVNCRSGLFLYGPVAFDKALQLTVTKDLFTARIMSQSMYEDCFPSDSDLIWKSAPFF